MKKKSSTQGGKNKRKGSAFERDIAKILSYWIYKENNILRRSPTSGAEKGYGQGADVSIFQPDHGKFKYFVEVKNGYQFDLFNARKYILGWYKIAKEKNKLGYPIWIIWNMPRRGIIIATSKRFFNVEELYILKDLYIYDFKDLTENYKYDDIIKKNKKNLVNKIAI